MSSVILLFILLTTLAGTCTAQTRCTDNSGCFPPLGNLALGRSINVSSTCGSNSEYCIFLSPGPDCFTCSPDSVNSPSSINDNNNDTSWYSEIGPGGVATSLRIDFEAPVLFQGMTMVWQSVRPRTMLLERSQDFGTTWQVYRYYSSSCSNSFMLPDTIVTASSMFNTTAPICTSSQSQLLPFTDGLVTFSTSQHLPPEATDAINYRTVTNLRVQLMDQFVELLVSGQLYQYYSLSEWLIWGSCSCNGHAAVCTPGNGETMTTSKEVYTGCFCEHNTEGNSCEMCQMGYNGAPWMPGTSTAANQCQECICNGHANDCEYNTTQSLAMCLDCMDNTVGNNCELCVPGFYQDETLLLNDPAICIPCGCNQAGIVDDGLCDSSGQCNCKTNVDDMSLSCSQCRDGYWNLTEHNPDGCQACDCNVDGSILAANGLPFCAKDTGECLCREGATGSQCEGCMDGFYDISAGCLPCECNQGGSTSQICDQNSANAQCPCIPNVESTTCRMPAVGYYSKALDEIIFEAEEATLAGGTTVFIPSSGSTGPFSGRGYVSLVSFSSVQFIFIAPKSDQYELIIRFEAPSVVESISFSLISLTPVTFDLNCDTTTSMNVSRFNFASQLPQSRYYTIDSVCLNRDVPYQLTVEDTSFTQTGWLVDSLLLLPDFSARSAYYASQSAQDQQTIIEPCLPRQAPANPILLPECEEPTFTLSTEFYGSVFACDCGLNSTDCYRYSGSCTCPSGVTGSRCDTCIQGMFNLSDSGCLPCDCDSTGSINQICNQDSGNCMCQPGVGGRRCDQCLPGFYNFSVAGCTPCQCSEYALLDSCDSEGQCTCPYGVTGLTCDQCQTNFYNISINGCTPCDCDPAGSSSSACDTTTGQCTCVGSTAGRDCSICPDGFFRTDDEVRDQCVRCSCMGQTDECVADNESYGLGLVLSNFSELCRDNPTACDGGWTILTADGEQAAPYGPSNADGLGYILLINHMPMLYAPEKYLGDRLATYGLTFSAFLRISNTGALNVNTTIIRIIGSNFDQELIGIFPPPTVTLNGFGAERYLEYTIRFIEDNWLVGGSTGPTATFAQFVTVLSNLTELSFSAQYTEDIIEFVHIVNISLQTLLPMESFLNSTVNFTTPIIPIVYPFPTEDCQCPEAYIGLSCEECSPGFARSSGLHTDSCVRCDCNNQTLDCDLITGVCLSCQGNSEGDSCERCVPGYYGDPTRSIDCFPCQCPLLNNNFSPTCFLNATDGLPTCDDCAEGYTGRNCEVCMDGYFGSPLMGRCTTCECNGNTDPALGPVCDTTTGQCLNCLNNTTGFECELCLPGYFGDPQIEKPCQSCPCDPGGTAGDCDSLFGTCFCQPGATGQLCNECIDGYWGISQGCIPCDCCTDGTIGGSNVCDKETGACTCKLNVGSDIDDKCCNCTPGYFNFSDQGCQACNCSALAVTEECDQVTGACVCQDGARGLKCDDCEYGYTGQVPSCERCHDCFFQWDDIINDLRRRIADLHSQTISLTQFYFSNYTVDEILLETNQLLADLQQANESLNTINLQENSLEELQLTIINLNITINGYSVRVKTIENELVDGQRMLDNAIGYDGTVNMTTVVELSSQLSAVNSTIAREYYTANRTIALILDERQMITESWEELNMLNQSAQVLFVNLSLARNTTEEAEIQVQIFNEEYTLLRRNLSSLAVHYDMLSNQIVLINQIANNASMSLENAEADFSSLAADVNTSTARANSALLKATQLNNTINATLIAAQMTLDSVNRLLSLIMNSTTEANSTLNNIGDTRVLTDLITVNLTQIKTVVERILNLSVSFSIEEAEALARQINETILPPEVVKEIVQNATVLKQVANQTLEAAMEASTLAMEAESVVQELQGNINSTNVIQQQVSDSLMVLNDSIQEIVEHIQLINDNATKVNTALEQAEDIYSNATNSIQFTRELGMNNTARASEILAQAMDVANQAQESQNGIEQAIEDYRVIDSRIDAEQVEAESTRTAALDLQARAETLNTEANQVSLEDLLDLLQRYNDETAHVGRLKEQVNQLQQRLQVLTKSFERASQRLQRCYKTP